MTLAPPPETVLEEAQRLVYGPRQASYGHPFDDFSKTGQMWGAILSAWRLTGDPHVPPELVALCQIAVKISREVNAPKRDNVVDIAGYAGTLALVRERQAPLYDEQQLALMLRQVDRECTCPDDGHDCGCQASV